MRLTRQALEECLAKIKPASSVHALEAKKHWDSIGKPLDGLGELENILVKIAAVQQTKDICLEKKAILVFCADNGIVEEGVSQAGQEVTKIVSENFAKGIATVNILASYTGAEVIPVDVGMATDSLQAGLRREKVAYGTKNFCKEAAMSEEEVLAALSVGMKLVRECKEAGFHLLGSGEMGIGNTSTSAALSAVLLQKDIYSVTGRGAGLPRRQWEHKMQVLDRALQKHALSGGDCIEALGCFGGLDIAALTGAFLGAALYGIPIVMDGLIGNVAALAACRLQKHCRDYIIASHRSAEPAAGCILEELGMQPVLEGRFCLGEGTGTALLFPLLDMAGSVYKAHTSFADIQVESYQREEKI